MRLHSLIVLILIAMPGVCWSQETAAADKDSQTRPSIWDEPTEQADSKVADWAAAQFAQRSGATGQGANPIRSATQRYDSRPPQQRDARVAPARYEQTPARSNPLRGDAPSSSPIDSAAKRAFQEPITQQPTNTPAASPAPPNPFAAADRYAASAEPAAAKTPPAPFVAATEPRPFEPATPPAAAPERIQLEAPTEQVAQSLPEPQQTSAEPVIEDSVVEPTAATPAEPPVERSIVASRRVEPLPFEATPSTRPMEPIPAPTPTVAPTLSANEGSGRPGSRELQGAQRATLVIEKRGPPEARVGQTCRFVLSVRNAGQSRAENVVLRDELPAGARLVETTPPAQQMNEGLEWRLGSLGPGEERSVEVHVAPTGEGSIGSVATVTFDAKSTAVTRVTKPELAVRLSAPGKVLVGERQPLKIEVRNPGSGVATGVMLVEDVPSNMRHEAGPELEFEVGSLAPGETRQLDLMLTAETAGHVINRLTAVADGGLRVEQSIEFDVVAPSLAVSVDGPQRRYLERPASYTVNVDNPGSAPAKDVRLVTRLPRGLEFVRANNLGEYDAQSHSVYWSLAELPEGERGAVELVAMPVSPGEHTIVVEGQASRGLKAAESRNLTVQGMASLAFDVRDLQDPIEVGGQAAYDVVVTNEGTRAAENVVVTIEAPPGMTATEARGETQHQIGQGVVRFAPIPKLEPGAKMRFAVRMTGREPGDQRVTVLVQSDELQQPIRREESTRVFGDE